MTKDVRKKENKRIFIGIFCIMVLGAALVAAPKIYLKLMEKNIKGIRIEQTRIQKDSLEINVKIDLSEKWIPAVVDSMLYQAEVYGEIISAGITRLDPHQKHLRALTFPVKVNNELLKENIKKHQGDSTEIRMYITQYVNLPLLSTQKIRVIKRIHMRIPVIPTVQIQDLTITDAGLDDLDMLVKLSVKNPNNIDFVIKHMKSSVQVKDYATSYSELPKEVHIKRNDVSEVTIPVSTDIKHELKALWKTITGDTEWPYHLKSEMVLDPSDEQLDNIVILAEKRGVVDVKKAVKAVKNKEKVGVGEGK